MQELTADIHPDHQVFMYCGHTIGDDETQLQSGYVVADTPQYAIESMLGYGFSIAAISSLAEIRETMAILDLIAERNPAVEPFEYLDLQTNKLVTCPDSQAFTFVGRYQDGGPYSKVGFVLAPSAELVTEHLSSMHFTVQSITSLADLREQEQRLCLIAKGDPDVDDYNWINLKLAS